LPTMNRTSTVTHPWLELQQGIAGRSAAEIVQTEAAIVDAVAVQVVAAEVVVVGVLAVEDAVASAAVVAEDTRLSLGGVGTLPRVFGWLTFRTAAIWIVSLQCLFTGKVFRGRARAHLFPRLGSRIFLVHGQEGNRISKTHR